MPLHAVHYGEGLVEGSEKREFRMLLLLRLLHTNITAIPNLKGLPHVPFCMDMCPPILLSPRNFYSFGLSSLPQESSPFIVVMC